MLICLEEKQNVVFLNTNDYLWSYDMEKELSVDYYLDGYTVYNTNCIDNPIAAASGYFNRDNYFFYSFYCSLYRNWQRPCVMNFMETRRSILNKLGIECGFINHIMEDNVIETIAGCINCNAPLILIAKYDAIFYLPQYKTGDHSSHAIIINGYDTEKGIVCVRDCMMHNFPNGIISSDPFFDLRITNEMLISIIKQSNRIHMLESGTTSNTMISLSQNESRVINNYLDLLNDMLVDMNIFENSRIKKYIKNQNAMFNYIKNQTDAFRTDIEGSIIVFFDVLERAFANLKKEKEYLRFKNRYIGFRKDFFLKAYKYALQQKQYSEDESQSLSHVNAKLDKELIDFVKRVTQRLKNSC